MGDLLELHALDLRVRLAVEELLPEAEVARRAPGSLQHLGNADPRGHLGEGDPDEDVPQSAVLDGGTVGGRGRRRGHGLGVAGHAHAEVDGDVPEPRELAHAAVLELGLAEVVDGDVVRDAQGIEADVAHVPLAVRGGGEEGQGLRLLDGEARGGPALFFGRNKEGSEHREHGRHGEQANDYIFLPFEAGANAAAEPTREATIAAFMVVDYLM